MKGPRAKKKVKKAMSATESVLDQVLNKPTWTVRPPEDIRQIIADIIRRTGVSKVSPLVFDIIRDELPDVVHRVLEEQRERRKKTQENPDA